MVEDFFIYIDLQAGGALSFSKKGPPAMCLCNNKCRLQSKQFLCNMNPYQVNDNQPRYFLYRRK